MRIGFIGSGKMATALMKAVIRSGTVKSSQIFCSDREKIILEKTKQQLDVETHHDNAKLCELCDIIFLCVKPQDMNPVLYEIKESAQGKLLVSIAAGISTQKIESTIDARVIRIMPNTPCLVGEMAGAYCLGKNAKTQDGEAVRKLLAHSGILMKVKEEQMDAITALSASGPGFLAYIIDAMAHAGIDAGLEPKTAHTLAAQTCLGTGKLLLEKSPKELVQMVKSPGGTTEAGINVLDKHHATKIIEEMINAARQRSKELGE